MLGVIPSGLRAQLISWIGSPIRRSIARWGLLVSKINAIEPELIALNDYQLRKRSLAARYRAKAGEPLASLLPEAYALVREAARRTLNMRHFDVQILGGIAMFHHSIVEMQTGEGKTLTATLPLYLYSLLGKGSHLATVNDYLARRDAEWMGPIYRALGFSVGIIETAMQRPERAKAYAADVTYGTAKEFGFDFLRDRLLQRRIREGQSDLLGGMLYRPSHESDEQSIQRDPYFALVDEADSILIDEARTPLVIASLPSEEERRAIACFEWSARVCSQFADEKDYKFDHEKKKVELAREGRHKVRTLPKPDALDTMGMVNIYQYLERAILVDREYHLDRQYVLRDGEIIIVDEFTGRLAEGRKWRDGIHQAVEAKEKVRQETEGIRGEEGQCCVGMTTGQAARVTIQDFFLRYENLAGMTGTAMVSAAELRKIYRCRVIPIPTNKPAIRKKLPTIVLGTAEAKWATVVEEIDCLHREDRPVLIGTRSIDKSEHLSRLLSERGIAHQVLNANHIAAEAEIVAQAGHPGRVTVSTNMAGRGTDIKLAAEVAELGGMHVICTEMHDSARIDRQLIGRCGRQGDPGTYRQFLALDDDLLAAGLGPKKGDKLKSLGCRSHGSLQRLASLFSRAQRKIERRHFRDRRLLMYHEKERKKMHRQLGQDPYLDFPG